MSRLLARLQRDHLVRQHEQLVAAALADLTPDQAGAYVPTTGGDAHLLRGIPALTQGGLGGAIIGTRPDRAILSPQAQKALARSLHRRGPGTTEEPRDAPRT